MSKLEDPGCPESTPKPSRGAELSRIFGRMSAIFLFLYGLHDLMWVRKPRGAKSLLQPIHFVMVFSKSVIMRSRYDILLISAR